jgi:REP element-mobilizing transposase RayT
VIYRIAGTIPAGVLRELQNQAEAKLKREPPTGMSLTHYRLRIHKQLFGVYDRYLDTAAKIDWLARPEVAGVIRENLYNHHGKQYHLLAYCVMPNHVHGIIEVLHEPAERAQATDDMPTLSLVVRSFKAEVSRRAHSELSFAGEIWQQNFFDRVIRDAKDAANAERYISENPIRWEGQQKRWAEDTAIKRKIAQRAAPLQGFHSS